MNELLTEQYLQELMQKHYGAKVLSCKPLGEGGAGKVYHVAINKAPHSVCIKLYKSAALNEQQAHEMQYLSQFSTIKFPAVYFTHSATAELPINALAMEFIDGISAMNNKFYFRSRKKREHCADLIIDSLMQIHNEKNTKFGDLKNPSYTSWNTYYHELCTDILNKAYPSAKSGELDMRVIDTMELAYSHFEDIFCDDVNEATLIHGDFFVANILVNPKTIEPLAFIDPFDSMWADVEYELFALNNVNAGCFKLYENYSSKAQLSRMCAVKCAFYALYKEIMWYQLYGTKYDAFIAGLCKKMKQQLKVAKISTCSL